MPKIGTLRVIAELAEDQWGLVTAAQASAAGLARSTLGRLATDDGVLERQAQGVYRLRGAAADPLTELRAAWLQLAPTVPVGERTIEMGVVSHRSAAAAYGIGELRAEDHEFTLPARRQSRRSDVRLHRGQLDPAEVIWLRGLPVTRPARIARDLLARREAPGSVGQMMVDALRAVYDYPSNFAAALCPFATRYELPPGDGRAVMEWLLGPLADPDTTTWMAEVDAAPAAGQ